MPRLEPVDFIEISAIEGEVTSFLSIGTTVRKASTDQRLLISTPSGTTGQMARLQSADDSISHLAFGNTTFSATAFATVLFNNAGSWIFAASPTTANAFQITDGTSAYILVDTRTTFATVQGITLTMAAPTIASAAGVAPSILVIPALTFTLTGTTTVTNMTGLSLFFNNSTVTSTSVVTVTTASTVYIGGAPLAGGSVTITNAYALHVAAGLSVFQTATLQASPLNFTAGGQFVLGTTDNNALMFKTNNVNVVQIGTNGNLNFQQASSITTTAGALTLSPVAGSNLVLNPTSAGVVSLNSAAQLIGGSAAAPAFYFGTGTTTGLYGATATSIGVTTGGTLRVTISSTALTIAVDLAHTGTNIGFFSAAVAAQQVSGANLTNNVTVGGVNDTIANYTDLTVYANDAAAIRNDIYQLSRKLKQVNDALRLYGLLT